jgi:hypothetical protein
MTCSSDADAVITVTKLRTLHPWVHVGVVIFKNDSIGTDRRGQALRVDRDVVVTGIVPEGDGPLVAFQPYAEALRQHA